MNLIAKTLQGLEDVLAEELIGIGADEVEIGRRMVSFSGNKEMIYKANFHLRTALRVLMPIKSFRAANADEVYEGVKAIDWKSYFEAGQTFCIDTTVYSDIFRNSQFLTYRVKDGVVDHFKEKYGERPSVRITAAEIYINVHIAHDQCTVSLDSSGESLHKRGYRKVQTEAPLNEVLAAGMILKTGWRGDKNFVDPMCGSGTLLIEAAMIALNIPGGIYRQGYAFERWKDYDQELFDSIYNDEACEREFNFKIYGSDISSRAIEIARENVRSAGLNKHIELSVQNISTVESAPENAVMVVNPPYGERISSKDIMSLYDTLGQKLKHVYRGYDAWVLSYHQECFDQIGLKPAQKIELFNGGLECEYRHYIIFDGKYNDWKTVVEGGRSSESTAESAFELVLGSTEELNQEIAAEGVDLPMSEDKSEGSERRTEPFERRTEGFERRTDGFKKKFEGREREERRAPFARERREEEVPSNDRRSKALIEFQGRAAKDAADARRARYAAEGGEDRPRGGFERRGDDRSPSRERFGSKEGGFSSRKREDGDFKPRRSFERRDDDRAPSRERFGSKEGGFSSRKREDGDFKPRRSFERRDDDRAPSRERFGSKEGGFSSRKREDGDFKPRRSFERRDDDRAPSRERFGSKEGGFSSRKREDGDDKPRRSFASAGDGDRAKGRKTEGFRSFDRSDRRPAGKGFDRGGQGGRFGASKEGKRTNPRSDRKR